MRPFKSRLFIKSKFPIVYRKQIILRGEDGLSGDYQWLRLAEAHQLINKYNISSVMEFGSGGSTILFDSLNLLRVDAFEQSRIYFERTQNALIGHSRTQIHLTDSQYACDNGQHYTFFETSEVMSVYKDFNHEMLYIDGPTSKFSFDHSGSVMTINKDAYNILSSGYRPKLILINARPETTSFLFDTFVDDYYGVLRSSYRPVPRKYTDKFYYHSFLLRNDLF